MNKKPFDDLKAAILAVLQSAQKNYEQTGDPIVSWHVLYNLQSEYNIHFVEPDAEQVSLL